MANEDVSPQLIQQFEQELVKFAVEQSTMPGIPSTGHSFALGYIFSMLKNGCFNEEDIKYRMTTF